jgi:hypothetical protein
MEESKSDALHCVIKSSRALIRISWLIITDVSEVISVPETSVIFNQLTRLKAREYCINFCRRESSGLKLHCLFVTHFSISENL